MGRRQAVEADRDRDADVTGGVVVHRLLVVWKTGDRGVADGEVVDLVLAIDLVLARRGFLQQTRQNPRHEELCRSADGRCMYRAASGRSSRHRHEGAPVSTETTGRPRRRRSNTTCSAFTCSGAASEKRLGGRSCHRRRRRPRAQLRTESSRTSNPEKTRRRGQGRPPGNDPRQASGVQERRGRGSRHGAAAAARRGRPNDRRSAPRRRPRLKDSSGVSGRTGRPRRSTERSAVLEEWRMQRRPSAAGCGRREERRGHARRPGGAAAREAGSERMERSDRRLQLPHPRGSTGGDGNRRVGRGEGALAKRIGRRPRRPREPRARRSAVVRRPVLRAPALYVAGRSAEDAGEALVASRSRPAPTPSLPAPERADERPERGPRWHRRTYGPGPVGSEFRKSLTCRRSLISV